MIYLEFVFFAQIVRSCCSPCSFTVFFLYHICKTVDQGCGYNKHWSYNEPDTNPAEHFDSIYLGCRVGYGIGITVTVISMCALYATTDLASAVGLDKKDGKDEPRYQRIEMSSDFDAGLNESDAVL